MANIKDWLTRAGFDWTNGRIILQDVAGGRSPGWGTVSAARIATAEDPVLSQDFDDGFGSAQCPRFVAEDAVAIYFPSQYDGATSWNRVWKDLDRYLNVSEETPYPGG